MTILMAVWFARIALVLAVFVVALIALWVGGIIFNLLAFFFYVIREETTGTPIPNGYTKSIDSKKVYVKTGLYKIVQ